MKERLFPLAAFVSAALSASLSHAQGLGAGSLFSRVDDQATKVTEAYAAIHEGFYGVGKERKLLRATLDVRPDGTPNITLDRAAGTAQFTIRLSVDEPAYDAWKADAHRRIEAVGMSARFSDFEDPEARVIGGKPCRFGDNEEAAIRRWEKSGAPKKAELVVRVEFVNVAGKAVKRRDLPIGEFKRLGFAAYPLPLHHLNRLKDLSGSRFPWGEVEDSYATFTLTGLTDDFLNSVADVKCTVIDDEILVPEREEAARIAKEKAEREARERAGAARIAREKAEREAREREEKAVSPILSGMVPIPGQNYKMGKCEVTQAQWETVMGNNPSHFKGEDRPVECVSWNDCQEFLKKLNALPTVKASGLVFRLPTEEEWEYACRAGATGKYCKLEGGSEIEPNTLGEVAWYDENSKKTSHPIGQKKPNAFGLYDMHGNVWEWTQNAVGGNRVNRGGSWSNSAGSCVSSSRGWLSPDSRYIYLGFRLCASGRAD